MPEMVLAVTRWYNNNVKLDDFILFVINKYKIKQLTAIAGATIITYKDFSVMLTTSDSNISRLLRMVVFDPKLWFSMWFYPIKIWMEECNTVFP